MQRPLPNITLQALRKKISAHAVAGRNGMLIRASSSASSSKGASVFSAADFNAVFGNSETSSSSAGTQDAKADDDTQDGDKHYTAPNGRHRRRSTQSRIRDCGVFVDRHGQLKVTDHEASQRKLDTVLVLSSVSTNFLADDFARLGSEAWTDEQEPFLRGTPLYMQSSESTDSLKLFPAVTGRSSACHTGCFFSGRPPTPHRISTAYGGTTKMHKKTSRSTPSKLLQCEGRTYLLR